MLACALAEDLGYLSQDLQCIGWDLRLSIENKFGPRFEEWSIAEFSHDRR